MTISLHPLRRLSPLALVLVALAAVLALSPPAHAQSSFDVKLHATGIDFNLVATAIPAGGTKLEPDNPASFLQRWTRTVVSGPTVRFSRSGTNACIRVPDSLAPASPGAVVLGSCSGGRAQWIRTHATGAGDFYVNAATRHHLSPPVCFFGPCDTNLQAVPEGHSPGLASARRWTLSTP